jgi:hypothetical protein
VRTGYVPHALGIRWRELGKPRAEAIVETVAHIACMEAGLDVSAASVPYVAGWAAEAPEVIEGDVGLIDQLAKWFAERLAEEPPHVSPGPAGVPDAIDQRPLAA